MCRPRILIACIVVFVSTLTIAPSLREAESVTLAMTADLAPDESTALAETSKAIGRRVLRTIVVEKTAFKPTLTIRGSQPTLKEWATCALSWIDNKVPSPIVYSVKNNGKTSKANWNCSVSFVEGRASSARINLFSGSIRQVTVATIFGNTRAIRAAFIKETICTRLAIEENLINGKLFKVMEEKTRMTQNDMVDKLATYVDGLAVYCLPRAERRALGVPSYVPYDVKDGGKKLCQAIDRLSREGYIRRGGLGQFLKHCGA